MIKPVRMRMKCVDIMLFPVHRKIPERVKSRSSGFQLRVSHQDHVPPEVQRRDLHQRTLQTEAESDLEV